MKLRRHGRALGGDYRLSVTTPEISDKPLTIGERIGVAIVLAMFGAMGAVGLLTIWAGLRQIATGETPLPIAFLVIAAGLVFAGIGLGYFYFRYVKKPLWDAEKARQEARYPDQPWMLRKDWAARRVVHSNLGMVLVFWFWNVVWWGALALIGTVNRDKILAALADSWWSCLLLALFVICGLVVLRLAISVTWAHWRFGRTILRLDTLPAHPGEPFRGTVEARLSARPTEPLKVELVCENLKWIEYRSGGKTTTKLKVEKLARREAEIPAARVIVLSRRMARIPVEIDVPPETKETSLDSEGNGVRWTVHLTAPGRVPFACAFEVPVYMRRR